MQDDGGQGFRKFYKAKIEELEDQCGKNVGKLTRNLKRLQAQRNELNAKGALLSRWHLAQPRLYRV